MHACTVAFVDIRVCWCVGVLVCVCVCACLVTMRTGYHLLVANATMVDGEVGATVEPYGETRSRPVLDLRPWCNADCITGCLVRSFSNFNRRAINSCYTHEVLAS
jgi:hypothetical protein